jgi:TusA-related sulfurtransferase
MQGESSKAKPDLVVDARGLFCPAPIIMTSEAMRKLDRGRILEVIADDPAIEFDMPAWCKSTGNEIKSWVEEGGVYRYFIVKK